MQRLALSFSNILKDELYIQYEEVAIHGKRTNFRQAQKSYAESSWRCNLNVSLFAASTSVAGVFT